MVGDAGVLRDVPRSSELALPVPRPFCSFGFLTGLGISVTRRTSADGARGGEAAIRANDEEFGLRTIARGLNFTGSRSRSRGYWGIVEHGVLCVDGDEHESLGVDLDDDLLLASLLLALWDALYRAMEGSSGVELRRCRGYEC
jgi:hypothetical protein